MTTEQLRKVIKVTHWKLTEKGLTISYYRYDIKPTKRHIILNPATTLKELSVVGSIEDVNEHAEMGMIKGRWLHYANLIKTYEFCQWEALSLVLRHEAEQELNNDINMLELDSALNALK